MKDKTGRPPNVALDHRNYHDLEQGSLGYTHSEDYRDRTGPNGIRTTTITGDTTLTGNHDLVLVDCSGGSITVTLPEASTLPYKQYRIKKIDQSTNPVRIKPYDSTEHVDDEDEWTINGQWDCMDIVSDGVDDWFMI